MKELLMFFSEAIADETGEDPGKVAEDILHDKRGTLEELLIKYWDN